LGDNAFVIRLTPFFDRYFNTIDLDEGPPPRLVNRSQVTANGVEGELSAGLLKRLWLTGHVTYTKTDIDGTDEALRNRPEWRGGVNLGWRPTEAIRANVSFLYVGEFLDSSIPTGDRTLGKYTRVDTNVSWRVRPNWELSLAIDNLLDEDYQEVVGFPAPGIRPRISARFLF